MADTPAWDALIGSLRELEMNPGNSRRTFPVRELKVQHDPTGFDDSYSWFAKLRFEVVHDDESLKQMSLTFNADTVTLAVHPAFVAEVIDVFQSVRSGGWDFGFGPERTHSSTFGVGTRDRQSLSFMFWQPIRGTE